MLTFALDTFELCEQTISLVYTRSAVAAKFKENIVNSVILVIVFVYILKDKSSAQLKVKNHIKSSSRWILFKFSHKRGVCVHNTLTKLHVLIIDSFVINRHNITRSGILRFPISKLYKLMIACIVYGYPIRRSLSIHVLAST